MDIEEMRDRLLALNVVVSALIETHPAPGALKRELDFFASAVEAHPLHSAARQDLQTARAHVARRLGLS